MLSIHLGDYPGSIYDTETYFRNSYLDSWFEDPLAAQMIKGVDGSELIGPHNIISKQLGSITPLELSGGVKTLLLVRNLPSMAFKGERVLYFCALDDNGMRSPHYSSTSKKSLVAPTNSCMFLTMRPSLSMRISKRFQGNFMMW